MAGAVIGVEDLVKVDPRGKRVIEGINFSVPTGELFEALVAMAILGLVLQSTTPWAFRRLTA